MHRPLTAFALAGLAVGSSAAPAAEPAELLKPMSFLAGHCWKGTFPDGKTTDEHCFAWMTFAESAPGLPLTTQADDRHH